MVICDETAKLGKISDIAKFLAPIISHLLITFYYPDFTVEKEPMK